MKNSTELVPSVPPIFGGKVDPELLKKLPKEVRNYIADLEETFEHLAEQAARRDELVTSNGIRVALGVNGTTVAIHGLRGKAIGFKPEHLMKILRASDEIMDYIKRHFSKSPTKEEPPAPKRKTRSRKTKAPRP